MKFNEYDANRALSETPPQRTPYWQRPPIKVSPFCRPSFILALIVLIVVGVMA